MIQEDKRETEGRRRQGTAKWQLWRAQKELDALSARTPAVPRITMLRQELAVLLAQPVHSKHVVV